MGRERKDYTKNGRRRRRKAWLIFQRDDFRCVYCGKSSVEDQVKLEAEHVVPRSQGGTDTAGNLVTSCLECNRSKFDQELEDEQVERLLSIAAERNRARQVRGDTPVSLGRSPQASAKETSGEAAAADSDTAATE